MLADRDCDRTHLAVRLPVKGSGFPVVPTHSADDPLMVCARGSGSSSMIFVNDLWTRLPVNSLVSSVNR